MKVKLKKKKCKACQCDFIKQRPLQFVCSQKCALKYTKMKKAESWQKLKQIVHDQVYWHGRAWKEISHYVRYSRVDDYGRIKCYTCEVVKEPQNMQAGHFKHGKRDYDLRNLRPQCPRCNQHLSGRLDVYKTNLIEELGQEEVEKLERDCEIIEEVDWEAVYLHFKLENKKLKQMKG